MKARSRRNSVPVSGTASPAGQDGFLPVLVEPQIAGGDARPGLATAPPQQGTDARDQLLDVEGLAEVVVGARLEAGHALVPRVAGGEHDDGTALPASASVAAPRGREAPAARGRGSPRRKRSRGPGTRPRCRHGRRPRHSRLVPGRPPAGPTAPRRPRSAADAWPRPSAVPSPPGCGRLQRSCLALSSAPVRASYFSSQTSPAGVENLDLVDVRVALALELELQSSSTQQRAAVRRRRAGSPRAAPCALLAQLPRVVVVTTTAEGGAGRARAGRPRQACPGLSVAPSVPFWHVGLALFRGSRSMIPEASRSSLPRQSEYRGFQCPGTPCRGAGGLRRLAMRSEALGLSRPMPGRASVPR